MSDSVDRVFAQALHTVRRIPRSGATRPPPADRLRLYGLYKQSTEGDVPGPAERPPPGVRSRINVEDGAETEGDVERLKWDAWNQQRGLSKTEAKRRYIELLIATMRKYAGGSE
ncbi:MAG: hypothetical protein M1823_004613 [Watsoniomyces obsoletus]|nr:MAG: hypothetical protein M1823_004613 [Watsoniomyces obsoletus]